MAQSLLPLFRLPAELRLQIYAYLLTPAQSDDAKANSSIIASAEYHQYPQASQTSSVECADALHIRIIDPQATGRKTWARDTLPELRRSKCLIRTDRFRARTMQTTYTATNNPGIEAAILSTCRQVYAEAAEVLYSNYTFDFDAHMEAADAFVGDLIPLTKSFIRSVSIVKRATPYDREFDRCEWRAATQALCSLPSLRTLHLGVVAGKPGPNGWDDVPEWSSAEFEAMVKWRGWVGLEWVRELVKIRLGSERREVKIRAIVEHCPMPSSEGMMAWVGVSRNVEGGFTEWVNNLMSTEICN